MIGHKSNFSLCFWVQLTMAAHLLSGIVVGSHHNQVMDSDSWLLHITVAFFFSFVKNKRSENFTVSEYINSSLLNFYSVHLISGIFSKNACVTQCVTLFRSKQIFFWKLLSASYISCSIYHYLTLTTADRK